MCPNFVFSGKKNNWLSNNDHQCAVQGALNA